MAALQYLALLFSSFDVLKDIFDVGLRNNARRSCFSYLHRFGHLQEDSEGKIAGIGPNLR